MAEEGQSRLSNPLMHVGRYCEFMLRRCFLPYALLVLALFNFTPAALYASAIGANVAWAIALYWYVDFTRKMKADKTERRWRNRFRARRSYPAPARAGLAFSGVVECGQDEKMKKAQERTLGVQCLPPHGAKMEILV